MIKPLKLPQHGPLGVSEGHLLQHLRPAITDLFDLNLHLLAVSVVWDLLNLEKEMRHVAAAKVFGDRVAQVADQLWVGEN